MENEELSTKALAALFGIGERRVQQLAGEGVFEKVGHGKYRFAGAGSAYKDYCVKSEIDRRDGAQTSKSSYDFERARKLKLENDKKEAQLIEIGDAIAAIDYIFGDVMSNLAGVAPRITEDVTERRRIDDAIDSSLGDLAEKFGKACAALQEGRDPLEAGEENNAG